MSKPTVIRYHHLGVVCTDIAASVAFYEKVGFTVKTKSDTSAIMTNQGGLELHFFVTKRKHEDDKNILMDYPDKATKFPGHTHMSFGVRSVPAVKEYFAGIDMPLSGTRGMPGIEGDVAVFLRDPDRTVLEFEKNDGKHEEGLKVTVDILSNAPRGGMDHVGTRVKDQKAALKWYREKLGFTKDIMMYEHNATDPLKNFAPWIIQTEHGQAEPYGEVDINLLLNGTTTGRNVLVSASPTEGEDSAMHPDGALPGILYAAYAVNSIDAVIKALPAEQVATTVEQLQAWGVPKDYVVMNVGTTSEEVPFCFVRDLDTNLFRLVEGV